MGEAARRKKSGNYPTLAQKIPEEPVTGLRLQSRFVGECIYCHSTESLSDEHAVPFGLGGDVELAKASCEACRLKIHPYETHFLSVVLGPLRHGRGMPSRPKKKKRGKEPPPPGAWVWVYRGNEIREKKYVLAADLPKFSFKLPRYHFPPFLMVPPSEQERVASGVREIQTSIDRGDAARQMKILGGIIDQELNEEFFCRTLAKISHAVAVGWLGFDGWEPYVAEYATGGALPGPIEDYIGGQCWFRLNGADKRPENANAVLVSCQIFPPTDDPTCHYVLANIHILPNIGKALFPRERVPGYSVVVGRCSEEKFREIIRP